jgi:hypothetical protein
MVRRYTFFGFLLLWAVAVARPTFGDLLAAKATLEGRVVDATTSEPVANAEVRIQTSLDEATTTDAAGRFVLTTSRPAGEPVVVTAGAADPSGKHPAYFNEGIQVLVGDGGLELRLTPVSPGDDPNYDFTNPNNCAFCHLEYVTAFAGSPHRNAANNLWVRDMFDGSGTPGGGNGFTYKGAHPTLNGDCAECHAPMASAKHPGNNIDLTRDVAGDPREWGVSCDVCHKTTDITNIKLPGVQGMVFRRGSASEDVRNRQEIVFGPYRDTVANYFGVMRASYAPVQGQSLLCAACHEDNNDHDLDGDYLDEGSVPSEESYSEWAASEYAKPGADFKSCQDCHMPPTGSTSISPQYGPFGGITNRDTSQVRSHAFRGTNDEFVQNAATVRLIGGRSGDTLTVWASVTNDRAGHDLPGGIFLRHAILLVTARDAAGRELQVIPGASSLVPEYAGVGEPAEGNYAGLPGKGFAKIFSDGQNDHVFFTEATGISSDTRIPAGATDISRYAFSLPESSGPVTVTARLLYRRAFRSLMLEKNWSVTGHGEPNPDAQAPLFGTLMGEAQLAVETQALTLDVSKISIADGLKIRIVPGTAPLQPGASVEVSSPEGAWVGFSQAARVKPGGKALVQSGKVSGLNFRKYWPNGEVRFIRVTNPDGATAVVRLLRDNLTLRPVTD